MNEDLIKCIDCESFADGRCEFCNGAEIENEHEECVCTYFSQKKSERN